MARVKILLSFLIITLNILLSTCVSSDSAPPPPKATPTKPPSPPPTPVKPPCPPPPPTKPPSPPPTKPSKCPKDTLKFGVCGDWLGLVHEVIGAKPSKKCCALVEGLADLEAAVCLCTAIKANVLGIVKLEIPVALSLIVNSCGKKLPKGFVC